MFDRDHKMSWKIIFYLPLFILAWNRVVFQKKISNTIKYKETLKNNLRIRFFIEINRRLCQYLKGNYCYIFLTVGLCIILLNSPKTYNLFCITLSHINMIIIFKRNRRVQLQMQWIRWWRVEFFKTDKTRWIRWWRIEFFKIDKTRLNSLKMQWIRWWRVEFFKTDKTQWIRWWRIEFFKTDKTRLNSLKMQWIR